MNNNVTCKNLQEGERRKSQKFKPKEKKKTNFDHQLLVVVVVVSPRGSGWALLSPGQGTLQPLPAEATGLLG